MAMEILLILVNKMLPARMPVGFTRRRYCRKQVFAPGDVTQLPSQPQALAYSSYGDMMIDIPALNLQSQIIGVPESGDSWNVAWLGNNIGWLNGTASRLTLGMLY